MATSIKEPLPSERAREIAELAEAIADEYFPAGKIAPEQVANRKGIPLIYDHYEDAFDGMIEYEDGHFYIHCNLDRENVLNSPRGRFTVSHELGHYFIDEHRNALASGRVNPHPSFTDVNAGELRVEREANLFGSHLLMPAARFAAALPRARKRLSGIQDLAAKFVVSVTCAAIRYVETEVEPSVMVHLSPDARMWSRASATFRAAPYGRVMNTARQVRADAPTGICRALTGKQSGVIGAKVAASTWFPALRRGGDFQLREEAMTLGRYGVLALLTLPDEAA